MAVAQNATPLIALDAVVIDTETTGLNPGSARIVEIAAVRIAAGAIGPAPPFRSLVQPGEPIPAAAAKIHGIDDATVAAAPGFAAVGPQFSAFVGDAILVGHTIGFDLAVIERECERAGVAWQLPLALDTQLLAQVVEPARAGASLESLAAWLDVEIEGRHSALGDAMAAARIFLALVPKLRARNVHTLAEAVRACRTLTDALDRQYRAGWSGIAVAANSAGTEPAPRRIDSQPYCTQVLELMSAPPRSIGPGVPLSTALDLMTQQRISSLFVHERGDSALPHPSETGIVTERDVMRALSTYGAAALALPAGQVMSRPLHTVPARAFAYLAIGRMNRLGVRHLGVTDDAGFVVGALSARDLLRLRAEDAVELGDEIEQASTVSDLGRAWAKLSQVAHALLNEGLGAREVAAVISHGLGELTRQAAVLAEAQMRESGHGTAPCPYAYVVLGSAGRGESLLAMDQDNALIHADGAPARADEWFASLGTRVSDILHQVGVPLCKGGVMARNPQWRGSLSDWRSRVGEWISRSSPRDLLSVDIFFDMLGVHGTVGLADTLWREAFELAGGNAAFAKLLIESAGSVPPGRTWFGGLRTEQGRIDLKRAGLFGIVSTSRALAICHRVVERSTPARLKGLQSLKLGLEGDLDAMNDAHSVFLDLILRQQLDDIERGLPASNAVEVKRLSRRDRERLNTALRAVEHLDEIGRSLLFRG